MSTRKWFGIGELVVGLLLIFYAVAAFLDPTESLGLVVFGYGCGAMVCGLSDITLYVRSERQTGFGPVFALVGGILNILLGILLAFDIQLGEMMMVMLFPIWFIIHSITRLANADLVKLLAGSGCYAVTLVTGILGLLLSFYLILNPVASAVTLGYVIALCMLVLGLNSLILAIVTFRQK